MTDERVSELTYYQELEAIDGEHGIYLVRDVRDGGVYIKKLLTVYNAEIYQYLMEHPIANTPKIYFAGERGGILTVIEEYIPGDTVLEILDRDGPFTEQRTVDTALKLCSIISDFHSCTPAIVNRDIKPSNVKITPGGEVKLIDLNAAKWCAGGQERDTMLLGTQGFAAPEQYGFGASSPLTDIYALGVFMNVMLTGELPGKKLYTGYLGDIIQKCTELSPNARYKSVSELSAALRAGKNPRAGKKSVSGWRKYLPPGFRSGSIVRALLAVLGYISVFAVGKGLTVDNAGPIEQGLSRITFVLSVMFMIFFNGNYLGICRLFFMTRSKRRPVRWLGMAIVDLLAFVAAVLLPVAIAAAVGER